ncbi:MAG: PD-(D/E)XK nuclease family protein [Akkermansiaceae bacterium]|nr:PD-(D/E)XK nuclease family protein [Akkermansiaceae bacterium]
MVTREFLGWDQPFVGCVADWLLARPADELPETLVLVPTAHSGHRLRGALVQRAGTLLAPRIVTPGELMDRGGETAEPWMESAAWADALGSVDDWSRYSSLFPEPPETGGAWAGTLAVEMVRLRRTLQENGHTLASAARRLAGSVESARWRDMARLEALVEARLRKAGVRSRSEELAGGIALPEAKQVVVAGVTEMPGVVTRALEMARAPVTVLIAAPENEADGFSETGAPLPCWTERHLPWPDAPGGSVNLAANPRHQAALVHTKVAALPPAPKDLALGCADDECASELVMEFARHGLLLHRPVSRSAPYGLRRWLRVWGSWLDTPSLAVLSDLLALPETRVFPGASDRFRAAVTLSKLRDEWLALGPDDLRSRLQAGEIRTRCDFDAVNEVLRLSATLERLRRDFTGRGFAAATGELLETLAKHGAESADEAEMFLEWLAKAAPWIHGSRQSPGFWLDTMLAEHPPEAPPPPEERDGEVLGWLELLFEPGAHLVVCGMNEGKVPPRSPGGPWLGGQATKELGLRTRDDRWARDAFLYQAMLAARREAGTVDVFCAKSGSGGDSLQPSRLLLAGSREELPARVSFLFRGIEPPDAGLRWQADWKWKPRAVEPPKRLPATSFSDYLQCPFRFYLKHCIGMRAGEPERIEWNARDFGILAHDLLERWGRDEEARDFSKTEAIHEWLVKRLEAIVTSSYGRDIPLAVRIQQEALKQRLLWFAREQACARAAGWEVIDVEHKFELHFGAHEVVAKIDRIDRHRETGELRVIDYKTGAAKGAAEAHRSKLTAASKELAHLPADCPAFFEADPAGRGKPAAYRWTNLQLPLYTLALLDSHKQLAQPCYFNLGSSEPAVGILPWENYGEDDVDAARACVAWIVGRIEAKAFWPPAEKPRFDDYAALSMGRPLEEVIDPNFLES